MFATYLAMFVLTLHSELSESEQDKEEQVYLLKYTLHVLITHDIGTSWGIAQSSYYLSHTDD